MNSQMMAFAFAAKCGFLIDKFCGVSAEAEETNPSSRNIPVRANAPHPRPEFLRNARRE